MKVQAPLADLLPALHTSSYQHTRWQQERMDDKFGRDDVNLDIIEGKCLLHPFGSLRCYRGVIDSSVFSN